MPEGTASNQSMEEKLAYRLKRNEHTRRKQKAGTASIWIGSFFIALFSLSLFYVYLESGISPVSYAVFILLVLPSIVLVLSGFLVYRHYAAQSEQFRMEYLKDGTSTMWTTTQPIENIKPRNQIELYGIVYKKLGELTPEEEAFVKEHSGRNDGKLGSAPEGPTYYTYDDMLDYDLLSSKKQVQFAKIIGILEKEMNTPEDEGYIKSGGYLEFVFDHGKKFGPISPQASTALYRILFKYITILTSEEFAVLAPPYVTMSNFTLDSAWDAFYVCNTHLEAIVNKFGEQKFERLVKILKEEIGKSQYSNGCIELRT